MLPNVRNLLWIGQKTKDNYILGTNLVSEKIHEICLNDTSILKLDSLLQEVCINIEQLNNNCPFFKANESLLNSMFCPSGTVFQASSKNLDLIL